MSWNHRDGGSWRRSSVKRREGDDWVPISSGTIDDPYAEIDWDVVQQHKSEFHDHPRGDLPEWHRVADMYAGQGPDSVGNELAAGEEYTVFGVCDKGYHPIKWPWTELDEPRDPGEMGIVAYPGAELTNDEHVSSIFSTATNGDVGGDQLEVIQDAVSLTDHHVPQGLAVIGHPYRYYSDPDDEYTRYLDHFEQVGRQEGLVGMEVLNKESSERHDGFGRSTDHPDLRLWDNLLSEFVPDRRIWGYGVDDPNSYEIGSDVDRRWTTVLLQPDEFDPADQGASRQAAMEAMRDGRTVISEREPWDAGSTDPPTAPTITDVTVDGTTITIDATDYETIEWISNGAIVEQGPEITVTADEEPYVRAELWTTDPDALTATQPFGIEVG